MKQAVKLVVQTMWTGDTLSQKERDSDRGGFTYEAQIGKRDFRPIPVRRKRTASMKTHRHEILAVRPIKPRLRLVNGTQNESEVVSLYESAVVCEREQPVGIPQARTRHEEARADAMQRLINLLQAGSPRAERSLNASHGSRSVESQMARLQAARATHALASLEASGKIERVSNGAYILRRRSLD